MTIATITIGYNRAAPGCFNAYLTMKGHPMNVRSKFTALVSVALVTFTVPLGKIHADTPSLRAGAAAVDITPTEFPLNMPGGFNANWASSAHDPFFARAMVLDDGRVTIAMVVLDSLGGASEMLDEAKVIASQKTGIPVENMMICSTHTHSGPPSNTTEGPAPAVAYRKRLIAGLAESIVSRSPST